MCMTRATEESGSVHAPARELLPDSVVPKHYDIVLEPDFKKLTFDGNVGIDLEVAKETSSISLHTLEIDIHSVKILSDGKEVSSSPKLSYDEETQVTKIDFDGSLKKGSKARLDIHFTGQLNDKMAGFYRSTYKKPDGSEGIMAVTQMEPTDARRSFPCFDEPALKAEFTVTLIADKQLTCLSNMDVASQTDKGEKKAVVFNRSPLMSTYLVAFIVGELNYIETKDFRVPIRVYAPPGHDIEHGRFSLDLAARTLKFYEKVFGIDFPLPKMDQVAIPDFAQGAMENWGLVTYRVVDLLIDEKASGAAMKERVAETVQHELAHQWFGNLVTMDWWDGLWLNEGFATWTSWVILFAHLARRCKANGSAVLMQCILSGLESLGDLCHRQLAVCAVLGLVEEQPPGGSASEASGRDQPDLRCHILFQRFLRPTYDLDLSWRRRLPGRR
jgi:aminopeptidase 2